MVTRFELFPVLKIAKGVGTLQGSLRLLLDTLPPELAGDVTAVADLLDKADERLTRLFMEHAPQPRGRAA